MHWFGGNIVEAVTLSKKRNAIFVVFVEGDNDLSLEMAATIDDSAVVTRLSDQHNFLAVKLKSGSTNYTHFARMYQFVPVPSLFFIGRNGTPLEVVCAGVMPNNLATRIDRILEEHNKDKPVQPSTSSENLRQQTVNLLQAETTFPTAVNTVTPTTSNTPYQPLKTIIKTVEKKAADSEPEPSAPPAKQAKTEVLEYEIVCEDDVCIKRAKPSDEPGPSQPQSSSPASTPKLTLSQSSSASPISTVVPAEDAEKESIDQSESTASMEERMDRAKELIEARRLEKADKDKEADKQKEMDRRAQGKGVAELKRWQAEQELKQIQEERKRERMANELARQRILEQIALDRAEQRARDNSAPPAPPAHEPQHSAQPAAIAGDSGGRARLQFKLPDGTSHTAHFDADGTLGDVQQYVANNLQLATSSFCLWTAFPRHELTAVEASLRNLQLAPSAALLVLPRRAQPVVAPQPLSNFITFFTQLVHYLVLEPMQQFYAWIRGRMYPSPPAPPRAASPAAPPLPQPGVGNLHRRGNIHRLPSDRPADDDNNTWNGNSTQQM